MSLMSSAGGTRVLEIVRLFESSLLKESLYSFSVSERKLYTSPFSLGEFFLEGYTSFKNQKLLYMFFRAPEDMFMYTTMHVSVF